MAKLDASRWRAEHENRDAIAIAALQIRIHVDVLHNDERAVPRGNRRERVTHVVAQMTVSPRQERQSRRWIQFGGVSANYRPHLQRTPRLAIMSAAARV